MTILPAVLLGFLSSILTEIFKFSSWISKTDSRKKATAFIITLIFSLFYVAGQDQTPKEVLGFFVLALTVAYASFKTIWQGLEETINLGR